MTSQNNPEWEKRFDLDNNLGVAFKSLDELSRVLSEGQNPSLGSNFTVSIKNFIRILLAERDAEIASLKGEILELKEEIEKYEAHY